MSRANAVASTIQMLFLAGNVGLNAGGFSPMTHARELRSPSPNPKPSLRLHLFDSYTGVEGTQAAQVDLRIPAEVDDWTQILVQDGISNTLGFTRPGHAFTERVLIPLLDFQSSNSPSDTGLTLKIELLGNRVWKGGWDGSDTRLFRMHLNIFYV